MEPNNKPQKKKKKKGISTAAAKAKGRRLQQQVAAALLEIGAPYGLEAGDITSTGMGQSGVDIVLSPAARKLFDLSIECKNQQKLVVMSTFLKHFKKYKDDETLKLLVHSRNLARGAEQDFEKQILPLVTMRLGDFLGILSVIVQQENTRRIGFGHMKGVRT